MFAGIERQHTGYVLPELAERYQRDPGSITDRIQAHFVDNGVDVHAHGTGLQIVRDESGNPVRDADGHTQTTHTGTRAVVSVGYHSLRHTFVSLSAESGAPMSVVQAIVGHGSPAMTRHYMHAGADATRAAVESLPSIGDDHQPNDLTGWAQRHLASLTPEQRDALRGVVLTWQEERVETPTE